MKGVVYGLTKESAFNKLEEIILDYEKVKYKVAVKICQKNLLRVVFDNNDVWEAYVPKPSMRGRAYNIAYIDHRLGADDLDIIMPSMKALPYQAWRRF